jgi:predicted outer membrane repeat protein
MPISQPLSLSVDLLQNNTTHFGSAIYSSSLRSHSYELILDSSKISPMFIQLIQLKEKWIHQKENAITIWRHLL